MNFRLLNMNIGVFFENLALLHFQKKGASLESLPNIK